MECPVNSTPKKYPTSIFLPFSSSDSMSLVLPSFQYSIGEVIGFVVIRMPVHFIKELLPIPISMQVIRCTPTYVILLSIPFTSFFATFLFAFRRSLRFSNTFFRCASTLASFLREWSMNSLFIFKVDFRVNSYASSNLVLKSISFGSEVA